MVTLMRYPCLQEDEGRHQYIGTYANLQKARKALEPFLGYFSERDFYTMETK